LFWYFQAILLSSSLMPSLFRSGISNLLKYFLLVVLSTISWVLWSTERLYTSLGYLRFLILHSNLSFVSFLKNIGYKDIIKWMCTLSPDGASRSDSGLNYLTGSPISNSQVPSPISLGLFHFLTIANNKFWIEILPRTSLVFTSNSSTSSVWSGYK